MPYSRYIIGTLPWYSVLIVLGMCLAIFLATREERRLGLPGDTILDLALWLIPLGVIGARVYYVVFAWETFRPNPISMLYIWQGGLAIYGGIIGGVLAVLLVAWRKKLSPWLLLDCAAPGVALAQAIGRWGNFFNMEAYGRQVTDPAWQWFPYAVQIPQGEGIAWFQATFFYESLWNLGVFLFLWLGRKKRRHAGDTFLWYLLLYGTGRVWIEGLRSDSLMSIGGGVRVSQVLSAVLVAVSAVWLIIRCRRDRKAGTDGSGEA